MPKRFLFSCCDADPNGGGFGDDVDILLVVVAVAVVVRFGRGGNGVTKFGPRC